jgi:hypothetical protein
VEAVEVARMACPEEPQWKAVETIVAHSVVQLNSFLSRINWTDLVHPVWRTTISGTTDTTMFGFDGHEVCDLPVRNIDNTFRELIAQM